MALFGRPAWLDLVPADRADRRNLRYRRHLAHPWISAGFMWVALFVLIAVPVAVGIRIAGGVPPSGHADDATYQSWVGSPAKGRSSSEAALVLFGLGFAGVAIWSAWRTQDERDVIRRIDANRIGRGVPRLAHDTDPPLEHRWFGGLPFRSWRRRRREREPVPAPRVHRH